MYTFQFSTKKNINKITINTLTMNCIKIVLSSSISDIYNILVRNM